MAKQPGQARRSFSKADINKLMDLPGVHGVLEGEYPLPILVDKNLPSQTKKAIVDEYGLESVELRPTAPIRAQGAPDSATPRSATPAEPASSGSSEVRVSRLRQFKRDEPRK